MTTIQQCRRLFFQAAKSAIKNSGESLSEHAARCVAGLAVTLAALLIGCTSLTPERVNVLASIAGQAAALGASEWLTAHPEHRPAFSNAVVELGAVLRTDNKEPQSIEDAAVEFLNKIPPQTLRGKDGEVYVTGDAGDGQLVVWDAQLKKGVEVRGAAAEPVVRKLYVGLRKALVPKPPMPPAVRMNGIKPEAVGVPRPRPAPPSEPLTLDSLLPEAPAPASKTYGEKKTNVVKSVLDIQTHSGDGLVPNLSVRWVRSPGSVYYIEHAAMDSQQTNWYRFACVTNLAGTGPTNWSTPWHPSTPTGRWRVLRVR